MTDVQLGVEDEKIRIRCSSHNSDRHRSESVAISHGDAQE